MPAERRWMRTRSEDVSKRAHLMWQEGPIWTSSCGFARPTSGEELVEAAEGLRCLNCARKQAWAIRVVGRE